MSKISERLAFEHALPTVLYISLCIIIYLFFTLPSINQPIAQDEINSYFIARSINTKGTPLLYENQWALWSPPLYVYLLAFLFRWLGESPVIARLIGISSMVGTVIILYCLCNRIIQKNKVHPSVPFLTCVLYVTTPMIIQGSLIIDLDNTILNFFISLFILVFYRYENDSDAKSILIPAVLFSLVLWSKLTTPLLLIMSLIVYSFLKGKGIFVYRTIAILTIGISLFLISWKILCSINNWPFYFPLKFLFTRFLSVSGPSLSITQLSIEIIKGGIRFLLWTSPYLVALLIYAIIFRTKEFMMERKAEFIDFLVLYGVVVLVGYSVVGIGCLQFPKYQFPGMIALPPILTYLFAKKNLSYSKREIVILTGSFLVGLFYFLFLVNDLLLKFNFDLREALAINSKLINPTLYDISKKGIWYLLFFLFFVGIGYMVKTRNCKKVMITSIYVSVMCSNVSLDIIHMNAEYMTRYCYGERGTKELVEYLNTVMVLDDIVLATPNITYFLKNERNPYFPNKVWNDKQKFLQIIGKRDVRFVVYSIGHNTIRQFSQVFRNPAVEEVLTKNFSMKKIGTYSVWEKKKSRVRGE